MPVNSRPRPFPLDPFQAHDRLTGGAIDLLRLRRDTDGEEDEPDDPTSPGVREGGEPRTMRFNRDPQPDSAPRGKPRRVADPGARVSAS